MREKKLEEIIWKCKHFKKMYFLISIVFLCGFLLPLYPLSILLIIYVMKIQIYYEIIIILLWAIITIICPQLILKLFNKYFYDIKFTKDYLSIKHGLLVRTKKFKLADISRIEIILGKTDEWYATTGYSSCIRVVFTLISSYHKTEKEYLFHREFHAKTKIITRNLKGDFERKFKDLKNLFPTLIIIREEDYYHLKESAKYTIYYLIFLFGFITFIFLFFLFSC